MAKYRVIVLGVLGINNKVFKAGDIVYDYNFPEGNAQKLLADGKLVSLETEKKAEREAKKSEKKAEKEEAN